MRRRRPFRSCLTWRLIPGIELGTQDGPSEVHLLGYFINHRDAGLRAALAGFREERVVAARRNVEKLRSMGVKITWERVRELAGGTVGRPHIAKAMVEGGYVESVRDAFDKYLGDNGIGRVSRPKLDPVDALGIIHDAGGVGAIAHPRTVKELDRVAARLAEAGLAGIEVYAEKYGPDEQAGYRSVARQNGLVECGGSDYHAFGYPNEVTPGLYGPPPEPQISCSIGRKRCTAIRPAESRQGSLNNVHGNPGDRPANRRRLLVGRSPLLLLSRPHR